MKKILLSLQLLLVVVFVGRAQTLEIVPVDVVNDRFVSNPTTPNTTRAASAATTCGPDSLIYALAKATGILGLSVNNATSAQAVSQYFDAPQDITINGASFYAFKSDATGGISLDADVSVFLAGPDSLPTGTPLTTTTVSVDTTFGGGTLTALIKHATFNSPVTVSQPYCVVVENNSPLGMTILVNDYTVGDGQQEWLGSGNIAGTWINGYDLTLGPNTFDADILIEPHVEYVLESAFEQTGICVLENGGEATWVNQSSPIVGNRMYNQAAFLGIPEASVSWNYGDGSPIENVVDGSNTYAGSAPWSVTLTDTIFGWTTFCTDAITDAVETVESGTLEATADTVCLVAGGSVDISASHVDQPVVQAGYETIYVLTSGSGLVIQQTNATPDFSVTDGGLYTIHTLVYDPNTLDLNIVVPGTTTGFDVNGLIVQGGGSICASLDVAGAPVFVQAPDAGTLEASADTVCLVAGGTVDLSATHIDIPDVPADYDSIYVLTYSTDLTIVGVNGLPEFTVDSAGLYTIHTLVYDPNTLNLGIVVPGQTTGFDVNSLLVQGGGSICAALDVAGAPIVVEGPDAGTLEAVSDTVCIGGAIEAIELDAPTVPAGYTTLYVLTDADNNLTVIDAAATPSFPADSAGNFIVHTLVYNPDELDPTVAIGLPALTVNGLLAQGGGSICAALDLAGAPVTVEGPLAGTLEAASDTVCLVAGGTVDLSATHIDIPDVPADYDSIYVLTYSTDLTIVGVNGLPEFTVDSAGLYTIHTLVYDPNTLNLGIVVPGQTTGVDVNGLLVQGGGSICAALDVAGAPILYGKVLLSSINGVDLNICTLQLKEVLRVYLKR